MSEIENQGFLGQQLPKEPDPTVPGSMKRLDDNTPSKDHVRMLQEHIDKLNKKKHAPNDTPTAGL